MTLHKTHLSMFLIDYNITVEYLTDFEKKIERVHNWQFPGRLGLPLVLFHKSQLYDHDAIAHI